MRKQTKSKKRHDETARKKSERQRIRRAGRRLQALKEVSIVRFKKQLVRENALRELLKKKAAGVTTIKATDMV